MDNKAVKRKRVEQDNPLNASFSEAAIEESDASFNPQLPESRKSEMDKLLEALPKAEKNYLLSKLIEQSDDLLQLKGAACAARSRINQVTGERPEKLTTIANYRVGDTTYRLRRKTSGDYWYKYVGSNKNKKSGYLGKDCPSLRMENHIPLDLPLLDIS